MSEAAKARTLITEGWPLDMAEMYVLKILGKFGIPLDFYLERRVGVMGRGIPVDPRHGQPTGKVWITYRAVEEKEEAERVLDGSYSVYLSNTCRYTGEG